MIKLIYSHIEDILRLMRSNRESYNDNSLCMELMGIQFRNPIMLASGFLGISLDVFDRLYRAGVGGIVTKSSKWQFHRRVS